MARYDPADAYNMINAPDSISSAIAKSGGVNTSAGNKLAWAYRREQEKAGRIPGVQGDPQGIGRQPMSNDQLGEMTLARMAALGQTPAATPAAPAPQQTMTRSMSERANAPVNARGVLGATFGEVNGRQMLVPQAGHYGEFQGSMAAEGLNGQMGVDRGAFEQRRSALVRQQEASRRQTKLEAKQATDRSNAAALALEDRKQANALALKLAESGYTQKDMVGFHADQLKQWQSDQTKAAELDRLASTAVNGRVMTKDGPVSLTAIQAQADGLKRDRPTYAQSLEALGTPQSNALAGSLPPGQQSIGAMARGAFNSVFGGQKAASAPAQSGKKETLGPNARKQYAAMDPAKRETYAAHYEQEGKPWLASEIRSL